MKSLLIFAFVIALSLSSSLLVSAQSFNIDDAAGKIFRSTRSPEGKSGLQDPVVQQMVNSVSTDALLSTLRNLQNFGTRYEYSPQREACATWLLNQYQQLGLEAHAEPYTFVAAWITDLDFVNDSCAYIVGDSYLLAKTTDGGATWNQLPPAGSQYGNYECVDFLDEERGWVIDGLGNCFKTTDAGNSWVRVYINYNWFHAVAFLDSTTGLVAGDGGELYRTTNGGSTWLPCAAPVGNIALRELKLIDAQHCYAVGDSGVILMSQDAGLTWIRQNSPVKDPLYGIDFVDGLHGWAVGGTGYWAVEGATGSLLKTTDGGQTWTQIPTPPEASCLGGVCALDPLHLLIADPRGRVFLSTDGGESWQMKLDLMVGNIRRIALRFRGNRSSSIGFVGLYGLLYTSSDGGASWQDRMFELPAELIHTSSNIVATIPGEVTPDKEVLLLAHYDSRSNNSMTFAPGVNDNGSGTSLVLEAARVCSGHRFASTLRFLAVSAEEQGTLGSSVYTRALVQRGANLIGAINTDMVGFPVTGDSLRLVAESYQKPNPLGDSVVLYQTRYGIDAHVTTAVDSIASSDHVPFSQAGYSAVCLSEGAASEVVYNDPYLHKMSDTLGNLRPGMVRRATQLAVATAAELAGHLGVSGGHRQPGLPAEISLMQNFPNPFNPFTIIKYTVGGVRDQGPGPSQIKLVVYDLLGREVAVLVDEKKAPGSYEVTFDAGNLASGVYFYQLRAGDFVQTRKLLLIR